MGKRRTWTIVLVPDDESGPRQFRVGPGSLRALIAAAIALVVLVGVGAATYWKVASVALDASRIESENTRLTQEAQKVWEIERLMADVLEMDYKIRTRMGIEFPEDWAGYRYDLGERALEDTGGAQVGPGSEAIPGLSGSDVSAAVLLFRWPINQGFPTSGFSAAGTSGGEAHPGIDIAAQMNSPVLASGDGRVVFAERTDRYGNTVEIDHGGGLTTFYGHNARLVVRTGQLVRKGDIIAYVGNTGRVTTGPHLHFEIRKDGKPVDPMIYLPKIY